MKKEFKVGDKCYIELTISEINKSKTYPIIAQSNNKNEELLTFTADGRLQEGCKIPILKHIEELQKSSYPKWMMVSQHPIAKQNKGEKRLIVYADETGFVAICKQHDKCNFGVNFWKYAKDIEENNELEELKKAYAELGEKIKQLEK